MANELEIHGEFWLPGHEDHRTTGILTFNSRVGGELSLIGSLDPSSHTVSNISENQSRIIGDDGVQLYTLDDCFRTNSVVIGPSLTRRQRFYVGQIIKGMYAFEDGEEVEVDSLSLQITNLLDWLEIDGIKETDATYRKERPSPAWEVAGEWQRKIACNFDEGQITFGHQLWRSDRGIHGLTIHQDAYAKLDFNHTRSISDALDYASDLQDLVSIATARVAGYKSVHLYNSSFVHELANKKKVPDPAELIMDWIAKTTEEGNLSTHDMLFTFEQLGHAVGVERWMFTARKYRSMLGRVMNTIYAPFMFTQDKILHRIAALEAFHKLWSSQTHHVNLVIRLEKLTTYAGEPFRMLVMDDGHNGNVQKWCRKATDERNEVAHHLGRQPHQDSATLFYLGQAAYWLLVMCLLRESGAPQEAIDHMTGRAIFKFESREICKIL